MDEESNAHLQPKHVCLFLIVGALWLWLAILIGLTAALAVSASGESYSYAVNGREFVSNSYAIYAPDEALPPPLTDVTVRYNPLAPATAHLFYHFPTIDIRSIIIFISIGFCLLIVAASLGLLARQPKPWNQPAYNVAVSLWFIPLTGTITPIFALIATLISPFFAELRPSISEMWKWCSIFAVFGGVPFLVLLRLGRIRLFKR